MTRNKILIGVGLVVVLAGLAYANMRFRRTDSVTVTVEAVAARDLEAIVSGSGKVQPKRKVDISAETMGKVVNLAVAEGELVKAGQLLLQIDPRTLETTLQNRQASLSTAKSQLEQTRVQVQNSKLSLQQAEETLARQENMFKAGLLARDQFERAQTDVKMRRTDVALSEQSVRTQEQRIRQEEANLSTAVHDLDKVRIVSPIDGIVTRRNIEQGETAVVGTMNNAGTVLLQIADLSVIETEIEVDETDIPYIKIGQPAKITIDAIANQTFQGHVTEVGNSPIQTTGASTGRATNFKVVVTVDGQVPNVRPGFTCTAEITTATRQNALSVPIQAMTVRELITDAQGTIVKPDPLPAGTKPSAKPVVQELKPGQKRKEFEGVFVVRATRAEFVPVSTGIAGDKYFEVLEGLKAGDEVITGPFASVRNLKEGDVVKIDTTATSSTSPASPSATR